MIKVTKHGNTYSEKDDINEKYHFQICPECMSLNTEIIIGNLGRYATTKYESQFLFDAKITKVNHKCNDCGCIFVDEYKDGRRPRKISDCLFWGIISFLMSIFMLFSLICSIICATGELTVLMLAWSAASILLFIGFLTTFIICLGGY